MHLRGLCSLSLFDRDYTYLIGKDGRPMYLGYRSSVIFYDRDASAWVWYDRKDNRSVAVSSSPEASLFLGVHTVDFAGVKDDKCHSGPVEASRLKQVKIDSIAVSLFGWSKQIQDKSSPNRDSHTVTVSDSKIKITILILKRGALSR